MMGVPIRHIIPVLACAGSDQSTRASSDRPPYTVKGVANRRVVSNVLCKFVHYEFSHGSRISTLSAFLVDNAPLYGLGL